MNRLLYAAPALVWLALTPAVAAQSLADAARRSAASRKAGGSTTLVFDERDLDPALARREVYAVRLDDARWARFVAADTAVAGALGNDPAILQRLQAMRGSTVRSLERFVQREPALVAALASVGVRPSEYTSTQLALVLAIAEIGSTPERLEELPPAVRANVAFLEGRPRDVAQIAPRTARWKLRMAPPPTAAIPVAAAAGATAPAPPGGGVKGTGPEGPDFAFTDFDGASRTLSEFRGRYVLLDFWGSWCGPCRREVPYMKDAYARFRSRGLEVIGMDYEEGASVAEVRGYLQQEGVTWTFATPDSVRDVIVNGFQVSSFPTLVLLDPDRRILPVSSRMLRGPELARTLDRVLPHP